MNFYNYFYAFEVRFVVEPSRVVTFGHGNMQQNQPVGVEFLQEMLIQDINQSRIKENLSPIDWDLWRLHIIAFNALPG